MTTHALIRALRAHLAHLEASIDQPTTADVVQLHPSTDPTWGGMLLRVARRRAGRAEGYLLIPRRGGCREAWVSYPEACCTPIGAIQHPEARWGFKPH